MEKFISGIQQIGIGIPNVYEAFAWYRKTFGMDVPIFDEAAEAALMLPYTDGKPQSRHAVFAINLQGGGGFEIWQYTSRTPEYPKFEIQMGDLGIYIAKVKCKNVKIAFEALKVKSDTILGEIAKDPAGNEFFFIKDPYNNIFQVIEGNEWFQNRETPTAGPCGAVIGVSDIDKSIKFYNEILGYDKIIYDKEEVFDDLKVLPKGDSKTRRVLLTHSAPRKGAFSKLFGASQIELIQVYDRKPKKIFENRLWGDLGFIHLCFDIVGMESFKTDCAAKGHPFTVDSSKSFDMGEAAGHFTYIEDPDGTLIEFVETYKIPIMKKIGWYLNIRKRNLEKPLPNWMLKVLAFGRVKD